MTLPGCSQGCFPMFLAVPGAVLPSDVIPRWSSGGAAPSWGWDGDALLEWHHHPARQSCAKPWWKSWKKPLPKQSRPLLGCSKAGSCVPNQQIPSLCQFPELPDFLQDGLHPRKSCFVTMMWMVTAQAQTRARLLRAEQESPRYLKFKTSQSFQNYFSWGVFVSLQSRYEGMVPVFKHK